jgi:hypothetical protein
MLKPHPQTVFDPNPAGGALQAPKVLHPLRVALEARRYDRCPAEPGIDVRFSSACSDRHSREAEFRSPRTPAAEELQLFGDWR